jgi:transposase
MLKQKCNRRSRWENPRHDQKSTSESLKCEGDVYFFYWKGIVHLEFVPRGETINKEFYLKVMKRLRETVRRKRPEAWTNKTWMLHHDTAPAHASLLIREFLAKQETIVVPQPPYSTDLAPADFFLFPNLKSTLKGRRFQTVEEIKEISLEDLRAIPQNTFQDEFQNWKKRWERSINSRGGYFEGEKSV